MSCITIAKEIKSIHPEDVALIKLGGFYKVYGKDAYILAKLLGYKIKEEEKIANCGFPIKSINKVRAILEKNKINYILIDSRDDYNINDKEDFKNLNKYKKVYEESKVYVNNQIKIEKIYEYLNRESKKKDLKNILEEIVKIIDAKR